MQAHRLVRDSVDIYRTRLRINEPHQPSTGGKILPTLACHLRNRIALTSNRSAKSKYTFWG